MTRYLETTESKLEKLNFKFSHVTDNNMLWYTNQKHTLTLNYEKNIINILKY